MTETTKDRFSTFSIDVDTASYDIFIRDIEDGFLPDSASVRLEEYVNYFDYDYPQPRGDEPFAVSTEVGPCYWNRDHRLVRIALQARDVDRGDAPPANLVFLVDVSGSMSQPAKLPLLKQSMRDYVDVMRPQDRVAIVTYSGSSGLVLEPTSGADRDDIHDAIDDLESGGSTAGAAGIELAYEVALDNFDEGANNRVILATDGDFNVGVSSRDDLISLIETKRDAGIYLSVLGFGHGNYQDAAMEGLADNGNGNYYFIDSETEGRRVLVDKMTTTILTVATDTKIQVGFNPEKVAAYRLIGYENRALTTAEFDDDGKDAGDMGAGSSVTAFYEIVPAGMTIPVVAGDQRGQVEAQDVMTFGADDLAGVRLRYKKPGGTKSRLLATSIRQSPRGTTPSADFLFASAVAEWGLMLQGSGYAPDASVADLMTRAEEAIRGLSGDEKREFVRLVRDSKSFLPDLAERNRESID